MKTKPKKPLPPVPRKAYDIAVGAARAALMLLTDMEKDGALRLPFPAYGPTVALLRRVVIGK